MFTHEVFRLLVRVCDNKPLGDSSQQYLDQILTPKEQRSLVATVKKLRSAESLEDLVGLLDYYTDMFVEVYQIDCDTIARWNQGKMTSFERQTIEFLLTLEAYDELCVHCCPACGLIHIEKDSHGDFCSYCWELLDEGSVQHILYSEALNDEYSEEELDDEA